MKRVFSREKAGLRAGCGVRSQVIDVLKAQEIKETGLPIPSVYSGRVSRTAKKQGQRVRHQVPQFHSLPAQCNKVHLIDPFVRRPTERVQVELDVDARVVTPTRRKRRCWSNQVDLGVDVVDT